jgi:hypothetical protein
MANALNPAAHRSDGLDAAVSLCSRIPAFALNVSDLGLACAEVERIYEEEALDDRGALGMVSSRR